MTNAQSLLDLLSERSAIQTDRDYIYNGSVVRVISSNLGDQKITLCKVIQGNPSKETIIVDLPKFIRGIHNQLIGR